MINIDIRIGIDQTVEIKECHIKEEVRTYKVRDEGHTIIKIIEVILGKEILEGHKIIEVRILEVDTEVTFEMTTLVEVEVGLDIDSNHVTSEDVREAVDQDQVQEQVLIGTGSDALSVSTFIFPKIVQIYQIQKSNSQNRYSKCLT